MPCSSRTDPHTASFPLQRVGGLAIPRLPAQPLRDHAWTRAGGAWRTGFFLVGAGRGYEHGIHGLKVIPGTVSGLVLYAHGLKAGIAPPHGWAWIRAWGVHCRLPSMEGSGSRRRHAHGYRATPLDNINLTKVTPCPIHRHRGTLGEPMRTAAGTFSPFFLFISGRNPFMGMKGIRLYPACA